MQNYKEYWKELINFHGHACPGLAMGVRISYAAFTGLELNSSESLPFMPIMPIISSDEELFCIAETDACGLDAIQFLLNCTMGKGNMLLRLRGKNAFSFYHRPSQKAVRILWTATSHGHDSNDTRENAMEYILTEPESNLLSVQIIPFVEKPHALISFSIACTKCGELTAETMMRSHNSKLFCMDCFEHPSRILS